VPNCQFSATQIDFKQELLKGSESKGAKTSKATQQINLKNPLLNGSESYLVKPTATQINLK
jgi:hypothetical protein